MVPPPANPKLVGVDYYINPSNDLWHKIARVIYNTENWFLSDHDYLTWLKAFGAQDFRLALAIDTKKDAMIGCVSGALFHPEDGHEPVLILGLYFVEPSWRNKGLGAELWGRLFEDTQFKNTANMGLVSVEKIVQYAQRKGFDKIPEARIVCARALVSDLQPDNLKTDVSLIIFTFDNAILELGIDAIVNFDASINSGIRREKFLKAWFRSKSSIISHVACNSKREIVGFISIRTSIANDLSVAPFYATSELIASTLLRTAIEHVEDLDQYRHLYFHPLSTNSTARKLFVKLTAGTIVSTATYTPQFTSHPLVNLDMEKIYSVTDISTCGTF